MTSALQSRHRQRGMLQSAPFLVISILLWVSCTPQSDKAAYSKEEVESAVRKTLSDYLADIGKEGLTAEFKYLDDSPDFFWVPPGYTSALSYDSVKTILTENAGKFLKIDFQWETLRVYPLSPEIATYTGIVDAQMTDTAGAKIKTRIIESGTMILRDDGWKILSGQSRALQQ